MLTKTQVKVILILLDNAGHAGWEIAELLDKEDSNLNRKLGILVEMGMVYKGKSRISKRLRKKKGNYWEVPYYLKKDLEALKKIIGDVIESERIETWFIFSLIRNSKYLESMRAKFGYDADLAIQGELRRGQIFFDAFYANLADQGVCLESAPVNSNICLSPGIKIEEIGEIKKWYEDFYPLKLRFLYPCSEWSNFCVIRSQNSG